MDANTLILTLTFGSFVFGFLLILFQYGKEPSRRIPFWITAKFLQGTGSLILYYCDIRSPSPLNLAADALLLLGCAYEGWAVFHITGRTVSRRLHLSVTGAIFTGCLLVVSLPPPLRLALNFLTHSVFMFSPDGRCSVPPIRNRYCAPCLAIVFCWWPEFFSLAVSGY